MDQALTGAAGTAPGREFVARVALLIALVAMSIDAMLPALGTIAADLGAAGANQRQWVLLALFVGLAVGQLLAGPLSDRIGRRPAVLGGLAVFAAGSVVCALAGSMPVMLAGRVVQGLGAAAPRIVTVAIVRDRHAGPGMARVMSLVMAVFILVPVVAPAFGQAVLLVAGWRAIFWALLAVALAAATWFALRQAETLPPERRHAVGPAALAGAARRVLAHPVCLGYTLVGGLGYGAMLAYLSTSQQIFVEHYGQGTRFPLLFALIALAVGSASVANARWVGRFGMRRLIAWALRGFVALAGVATAVVAVAGLDVPLPLFMLWLAGSFFGLGIVFGNANALAMEPLGQQLGLAASVMATLTTGVSVTVGSAIGQHYDGTLRPMAVGYLLAGSAALGLAAAVERWGRRRS